ncbi:MAG: glycosyltransferase family 4 protein [bacterium]
MSGLHVAYVLKVYPRLSETFIVNEILELERAGVQVTVFSLKTPREGRFHEKLARVRADVVYVPDRGPAELVKLLAARQGELAMRRERILDQFWNDISGGREPDTRPLGQAIEVALEAEARGVDHFHAHFATIATDVARRASALSGIPFSFTTHAKDIYHEDRDRALMPEALGSAAFAVTVCDANVEALRPLCPPSARLHRIYNGLNLDEFRAGDPPRNERPRVLGVGRLVPKKGFDTLLHAARILMDRGVDFEGELVGDGSERASLEALAAKLRLGDRFRLVGPRSNEEVRHAFQRSDVFALPCRVAEDGNRDALPTVLLESMALGCPVVTTPVTGNAEIVDGGRAGLLVPPDDAQALADAMAELFTSPARREELRQAGHARVRELFDVRRSVAELRILFEGAAARASLRSGTEEAACASSI